MALHYLVPRNEAFDPAKHQLFLDQNEAVSAADAKREAEGVHYHVLKVETVWTTTTLADLLAEQPNRYKGAR